MGGKSSKTKIVAPSAQETADAQSQANLEAIYASALANRYNEVTPYGSVTWQRPGGGGGKGSGTNVPLNPGSYMRGTQTQGGPGFNMAAFAGSRGGSGGAVTPESLAGWTRTTTLSPEMQRQFDLQNQITGNLQQSAADRSGQLPDTPFKLGNLPQMQAQLQTGNLPQLQTGINTGGLPEMATGIDTSGLPSIGGDYSQDATRVEQATFDRAQQLMNPQFENRRRDLETQLANTGIPVGSEAYTEELRRFDEGRRESDLAAALESVGAGRAEQSRLFDIASRSRGQLTGEQLAGAGLSQQARQQGVNEQLAGAGLAQQARQQGVSEQLAGADLSRVARQQGVSEQQLVRNQNLNELAALIQGSPAIQTPTSAQPAQYQVAPADFIGANQLGMQAQIANAQNAASKKGGTAGLAGTLGAAAINAYSDIRLKTDVQPVLHFGGHQYYRYNWAPEAEVLGLSGEGFGVIADEVEQYAPHLVSVDPDNGYKKVNYGGLH